MPPAAREKLVLGFTLALALFLSLHDARVDSATADEPIHLAAGVVQVQTGTWLVNVEHPPLAKQLFGWAAAAAGARETPRLVYADFLRSTRDYTFLPRGPAPRERPLLAARAVAAVLFTGLVAAAYAAAGGGAGGLLAAGLMLGQTAVLPHGHLVTTDVPLALFAVISVHAAIRFGETGRRRWAAILAGALALALLVKTSGLLLLPLVAFLLVHLSRRRASPVPQPAERLSPPVSGPRRRFAGLPPRRLLAPLAAAVLVPLAAILLTSLVLRLYTRNDPPGALPMLGLLYGIEPKDMALPMAIEKWDAGLARYVFSFVLTVRQTQAGRLSYFLGEVTTHPSALYHPAAIALKSPLVWLASLGISGWLACRRGGAPSRARLFLVAGLFFLLASLPGPKIGVRHAMPAIALLTVGTGAVLGPRLLEKGPRWLAAALLATLAPLLFGRSLGALNLVGRSLRPPPLADSNLDWGQDLVRLATLLQAKGISPDELSIAYFGGDLPAFRLPGCADLQQSGPLRRYVAISRQYELMGADAVLHPRGRAGVEAALAAVAPSAGPAARFVARAGDSIDLYELAAR